MSAKEDEDRKRRCAEKERESKRRLGVLTGEGLLVALPHGDEVTQAGVELLHNGLPEEETQMAPSVSRAMARIQTLGVSFSDEEPLVTGTLTHVHTCKHT